MQITGEGVDTVLRPGFMPFDAFVFLVIKALGASDAEGLSTEESYSFVIFLRAAVQMGLLR